MSTNARDTIFQQLRQGVNNPELMADRSRKLPPLQPTPFEPAALVERWRAELEALTGKVYGPLPPNEAMARLMDVAGQYSPKGVIAWDDADLPLPNVAAQLQAAGFAVEQIAADAVAADRRETLAQIPVGITGAIAGLADTGSIIVDSGAGRARGASLLPPVHVALLPVASLYPDLPTWMSLQGGDILADMANLTIISGPSKTADIELNLVLGVHGPGEIHVILLA
ncbi:MAG: lactate utilization protein [Anaerolineae bacterium]